MYVPMGSLSQSFLCHQPGAVPFVFLQHRERSRIILVRGKSVSSIAIAEEIIYLYWISSPLSLFVVPSALSLLRLETAARRHNAEKGNIDAAMVMLYLHSGYAVTQSSGICASYPLGDIKPSSFLNSTSQTTQSLDSW